MPDARYRTRLLAAALIGFLLIQTAVPVVALFGPRPARFGWHMYSALPPVPEAWTISADGSRSEVDLGSLFAVQRAEIDYLAVLRSGLCDVTNAPAVEIRPAPTASTERITCR